MLTLMVFKILLTRCMISLVVLRPLLTSTTTIIVVGNWGAENDNLGSVLTCIGKGHYCLPSIVLMLSLLWQLFSNDLMLTLLQLWFLFSIIQYPLWSCTCTQIPIYCSIDGSTFLRDCRWCCCCCCLLVVVVVAVVGYCCCCCCFQRNERRWWPITIMIGAVVAPHTPLSLVDSVTRCLSKK